MHKITAVRYHDICMGHRVVGHEGKCRNFHGHNYRFYFHCTAERLDSVGRVIDFSCIKETLCEWLEDNWDHRMLLWEQDPSLECMKDLDDTVVIFPYNPTAENIGRYLVESVAGEVLPEGVSLTKVVVEETRKCSVEVR